LNSVILEEVTPRVTVILPAYNESDNVGKMLQAMGKTLDGIAVSHEVILVDDGSTDDTRQKAIRTNVPGLRVVWYNENIGKGYALKYGARFALGKFVFFMDSDLDIEPSNLVRYLKGVQDADLVIASKRHPRSKVEEPLMRRMLSLGFHILVRLLAGIRVSDTQAGLKAFRSESLRKILPLLTVKNYAFDVEVLTVAQLLKMRIVELPLTVHQGAHFEVKHIVRMAVDLLGITYRLRVKHWYQKNLNNRYAEYKPLIKW